MRSHNESAVIKINQCQSESNSIESNLAFDIKIKGEPETELVNHY